MKQLLIDDICLKLNELRIPFTLKDNTYIYVNTEFYDIGYGTEPKMVIYDLSVFLDEANQAVFLYVKTADKQAPNADGSRENTAQISTIFRKVRHVCYDQDGKVSVITIDLGEIPNSIKNAAFKYSWRFKTALNLNKATKKAVTPELKPSVRAEPELVTEPVSFTEPEMIVQPKQVKKAGFGTKLKGIFHR
jgi:hypothetical protein